MKLTMAQQKYNRSVDKDYEKQLLNDYKKAVNIKSNNSNLKNKTHLIEQYSKLKKEYQKIDDDETLKKYEILSKANKLGKKIYGVHYSIAAMAIHFDIPYTTCKRIMSLERANERTWKLIYSKKISAFKVAQICLTKNYTKQDNIVDAVIKDNLSTYQIKRLDVQNKNKFKEERLNMVLERGFSRQDVAYKSLIETITRLNKLLDTNKTAFPTKKIPDIIESLEDLKDKIEHKIHEWTDLDMFIKHLDEEDE
jgi:hypothetical protein